MSEAAHSLHFWHATTTATRALALSAGTPGRLFSSNNQWTTFVPLDEEEGLTMIIRAPYLALRWIYFQDFGLGLEFWEKGVELGRAEFHWETGQAHEISTALEARLAERDLTLPVQSLLVLAQSVVARSVFPDMLRDRAAALLGLPAYRMLSPASVVDTPIEAERDRFPDAEDVEIA